MAFCSITMLSERRSWAITGKNEEEMRKREAIKGPREGDWVVSLRGTCAGVSAGALVPIVPGGFDRASSQFFARPATEPEVAAALHTLSQGRKK